MQVSHHPIKEPTLEELLSEPMVQQLMQRDGITRERLVEEFELVARLLTNRRVIAHP